MMKFSFINLNSSLNNINYFLKPVDKLEKEMKKLKCLSMERIIFKNKNPLYKLNNKEKLFKNNKNTIIKIKTCRNEKPKSIEKLINRSQSYFAKRNKKKENINLNKKIKKMNNTTIFNPLKIIDIKKNPFEMINLRAQHLIKKSRKSFLFENQNKTQFSSIRNFNQEHIPISNIVIKEAIG